MKIDKLSLPHPVLGLADDVSGEYNVPDFNVKLGREKTLISIYHKLSNPTLEKMIKEGKAIFCADVNCPKTLYRKAYTSKTPRQEIEINTDDLRDRVTVTFLIISLADDEKYQIAGANKDYGDYHFLIKKGDVLGFAGEASFIAAKRWKDINKISSFMVISEGENKTGPFEVDLNAERIVVYLSKEDYELFKGVSRAGFDPIFHSSVVIPVLIYALQSMDNDNHVYDEFKWYQVLQFKKENDEELSTVEWSPDNYHRIAQILLENPLTRTLNKIDEYINAPLDALDV